LRTLGYLVSAEILALALLALTGFVCEHRAQPRDNELYGRSKRLVDVGGYRLRLNCSGEGGPAVILEYGLQGSYLDWYSVQPEIVRFTRVCSYDRAGYSWSDPSLRSRIPSVVAEALHTLLHAAGEKPPYILAAHSYGSFTAVMFAHWFPDEGPAWYWWMDCILSQPSHLDCLSVCRSVPCKSWFRSEFHAGVTGSEATCQRHCEGNARRPGAGRVHTAPFIGSEPIFRKALPNTGDYQPSEPFL
jgi:pimeloyl-ACP methyl ester carboxylesterase